MKYLITSFLYFLLACSDVGAETANQQENAEQLGYKIMAVQNALIKPTAEDAMDSIMALGSDSRYYLMTRGWLREQLRGDLSIQASSEQTPVLIQQRIKLLQTAIRAIDLE